MGGNSVSIAWSVEADVSLPGRGQVDYIGPCQRRGASDHRFGEKCAEGENAPNAKL